ncbi:hypothetical protein C8J57DRAFT_1170361 [Mycena rebaudengoi]|nr:hypothetical protein C8J57DRAFT_1170361 [Mycena rebaudengoi]
MDEPARDPPSLLSPHALIPMHQTAAPYDITPLERAQTRPTLAAALLHPRILASLLSQVGWRACWTLVNTCRNFRNFFASSELKDVILSRFVPGYAACLRISDPLRLQNVPVTLTDLHLLTISQTVAPLHRYPMHALSYLSASQPDNEQLERTSRLATFAQVHSRFVLLLQALAHSSNLPPPPDPEEDDWTPPNLQPKLRQLTFPAPLSQSPPPVTPVSAPLERSGCSGRAGHDSLRSGKSSPSLSKSQNRLSLLRKGSFKVPPPPASEPRSLKYYTGGWRHPLSRASESTSDDEWGRKPLERPHRRFASVNLSSDSSSFSNSPSPPFSRASTRENSSPPFRRGIISHHDLSFATSRTRAPIIRVFVPCTDLSANSDSISRCEDQLYDSGLWHHLSTGDIVCNLGYLPPHSPDEPESSNGSLSDSAVGSEPALHNRRKWLLFNGSRQSLVPFSPPESLPLSNPFILPSPCYYTHIMPPSTDPVFTVRSLPPCDDIPQLTLVNVSTKVRSPHSPTGYAAVKRPAWIARVWRQVAQDDDIGLGWQGEWVLEGEGTHEGQKVLLDCLRGVKGPPREWQIVREKSTGGRIWFRLIRTFSTNRTKAKSANL